MTTLPRTRTRIEALQLERGSLQSLIADLEDRAEGHLDHGRTPQAIDLQARAANLRRNLLEVERELQSLTGLPKRTMSWRVER